MLTTLFTNDVRQTLDQFRRSVDEMFEDFYAPASPSVSHEGSQPGWTFRPVWESGWNENFFYLRAILPGVSEKDIQVSVQNNQLIVQGERKAPEGFGTNTWSQLAYGKFHTALTLPGGLDLERVRCRLSNGVLDIQVPILEASKPKQIQIETGETHKAISA